MSISGVSSSTGASQASSRVSNQVKEYNRQIGVLKKKISQTQNNEKMDDKTKAEVIKELRASVELLESSKAQVQAEAGKVEQEKKTQTTESSSTKPAEQLEETAQLEHQKAFIQLGQSRQSSEKLGMVRTNIKNELRKVETTAQSISTEYVEYDYDPGKGYFKMKPNADPVKATELHNKLASTNVEMLESAQKPEKALDKADKLDKQAMDKIRKEEAQQNRVGHGRMEPGQFLNEDA